MKLPTGLPELKGRWLTAYRVLWIVMFAIALIGLTAGTWINRQQGASWDDAYYGAGLRQAASEDKIYFSPISVEVKAAGIKANSTLLAVDGQAMPDEQSSVSSDRIARALAGPDGRVLRLTMRAPDGKVATHQVRRGPHHLAELDRAAPMPYDQRQILYLVARIAMMVPMLAAAALLYFRRVRDPVVALMSLGLVVSVAVFAVPILPFELRGLASKIINPFGLGLIWLAILTFPTGRFEPRWSLLAVPLLIAMMTGNLWAPTEFELSAAIGLPLVGLMAIITSAAIIVRYRRLAPGIERQQVKWAMLGFGGLIILMLVSTGLEFLDRLQTNDGIHFAILVLLPVVSLAGFLSLIGGLLVSLLRYRLYDAEAAISRSAVYAALTVSLLAIFAGTEKFIEILGEQYFGESIGAASGAVAAGLAAVMIAPMHKRMSDWAERRFQRGLVRLRRDLPRLVGDLRETASPAQLGETALDRIAGGVRASSAALILCDGDNAAVLAVRDTDARAVSAWRDSWAPPSNREALDCDRADAAFPIRIPLHADEAGTVGWILLGPRPDGSFYGKDEREVLLAIADPVARGLAIAIQREARETGLKETTASLTARLAAVEEAISRFLAGTVRKPA